MFAHTRNRLETVYLTVSHCRGASYHPQFDMVFSISSDECELLISRNPCDDSSRHNSQIKNDMALKGNAEDEWFKPNSVATTIGLCESMRIKQLIMKGNKYDPFGRIHAASYGSMLLRQRQSRACFQFAFLRIYYERFYSSNAVTEIELRELIKGNKDN